MENKFKDRLKGLRIENNLTQEKLSAETHISQAAIAKWENGVRTPSMECLIILVKYFKVSADYLLGLED
ncbi:MAG: helix-turn-helix transcriptional regulator [Clostridia bacterium]|nr:helix-turn-helix transcriptional regulator [Clostridia bacterium]